MRTFRDIHDWKVETFHQANPDFSGYNQRFDMIVKCEHCDQAFAWPDMLYIRPHTRDMFGFREHRHEYGCPFCNRFINKIISVVKLDKREVTA